MSYVFQAVLCSARHPKDRKVTLPFPIPREEYDHTIELLAGLGFGSEDYQDCLVTALDSPYTVLKGLIGRDANVDELDYLAKRLEGLHGDEGTRFQEMAHKLDVSSIRGFINLTFFCQKPGQINMKGRGVSLEEPYDGWYFPPLVYGSPIAAVEVFSSDGEPNGTICLPASDAQLLRQRKRTDVDSKGTHIRVVTDQLPEKVSGILDLNHLKGSNLPALNCLCRAVESMEKTDLERLNAAVLLAEPRDVEEILRLAANLEQFDFIPGVQTPEKDGQFPKYICMAYHGTQPLEKLMWGDAPNPNRQGPQMGGPA